MQFCARCGSCRPASLGTSSSCALRCPSSHALLFLSDDKFYETHVIKFDRVFAQCFNRNNLISSCILDLFERLRKDSQLHKALIEHLCTCLRAADVGCVKQLIELYEQQCEHSGSGSASGDATSAGRPAVNAAPKVARTALHRAGRDIGNDDESYFDHDTEEDICERRAPHCGGKSSPSHASLQPSRPW
jgi:hypothetical protein